MFPAREIAPLRAYVLRQFPATPEIINQDSQSLNLMMKIQIFFNILMISIYIIIFSGVMGAAANTAKGTCLFVTGAFLTTTVSSSSNSLALLLLLDNCVAIAVVSFKLISYPRWYFS